MVQFSLLSKLPREEPLLAAPDPNLVVNHTLPVQVFFLTGQYNMQRHGRIWGQDVEGTVEYITKKQGKYKHLLDSNDKNGGWSTRPNVYTVYRNDEDERILPLRVGVGTNDDSLVGPELQIGQILGESLGRTQNQSCSSRSARAIGHSDGTFCHPATTARIRQWQRGSGCPRPMSRSVCQYGGPGRSQQFLPMRMCRRPKGLRRILGHQGGLSRR
jgi:hypothetical protein